MRCVAHFWVLVIENEGVIVKVNYLGKKWHTPIIFGWLVHFA